MLRVLEHRRTVLILAVGVGAPRIRGTRSGKRAFDGSKRGVESAPGERSALFRVRTKKVSSDRHDVCGMV